MSNFTAFNLANKSSNSLIHKGLRQRYAAFTIVDALFALAIVGLIFPTSLVVFADLSGPGTPSQTGCPYAANRKGPCTDPCTYSSHGAGNGLCGTCGNITYSYAGGSCTGTSSNPENNCAHCTRPKDTTRIYESEAAGYVWLAGCLTAAGVCAVADNAAYAACVEICWKTGVFTGGQSCWWCLSGVGAGGAACICAYNECVEECKYTGTVHTGETSSCSDAFFE